MCIRDRSRGARRRVVAGYDECSTGRQIAEENQGETDGTDTAGTDCHPLERHCGKCEPKPERLGELLPLSELKSGNEQSQAACGRPVANPLDEAPQGEGQRNRPVPIPAPRSLCALRAVQSFRDSGLELGACPGMKNIGKPCAGEPHARFDEGGQAKACSLLYSLVLTSFVGQATSIAVPAAR